MPLKINGLKTRFLPGVIRGSLDLPAENSQISGVLEVAGWAFSRLAPIVRVEAFIDDILVGTVRYELARPDVANRWPKAANSGFSARLNPDIAFSGPKILRVRVSDALGNYRDFTRPILLKPPSLRIQLDLPQPGVSSAGLLPIEGWVYTPNKSLTKIEAFLDNQFLRKLAFNVPRPDVEASFSYSPFEYSGFRGLLSFEPGQIWPRTLLIRATSATGEAAEVQLEINQAKFPEPVVEIEQASWQNNLLQVSGYAFWMDSQPPCHAKIYLNEKQIGEILVNLSRPDVAQKFPIMPVARHSGFRFVQLLEPELKEITGANQLKIEFLDGQNQTFEQTLSLTCSESEKSGNAFITQFAKSLAEIKTRLEIVPPVLDWNSGAKLAEAFPELTIFTPPLPVTQPLLPYIDQSLEVIVTGQSETAYLAEARRVATIALIWPENGKLKLEWLAEVTPRPSLPSVSIIIPVYNKLHYTQACLEALQETLPPDFWGEIIVIDDCSSDETPQVLTKIIESDKRIKYLRNETNSGFIDSCNRGAEAAIGEILVFLNNDTLPRPNWLPPLLKALQEQPQAGAVGGKLIYPDGSLQEAGSVIFSDGSGCNFGRGDAKANDGLYSYLREVDYCSGALLATPRALFQELGGFDTRYRPAYYEDTDYCFKVRAKGLKVYYQPESIIVHFEGVSSGRDVTTGVKSYQLVNQRKFVEKWADTLKNQPAPPLRIDYENLQRWAVRQNNYPLAQTQRIDEQ